MGRTTLAIAILLASVYGCGIQSAIDEIQGTIEGLHASDCIRVCSENIDTCLDKTNGPCIDNCEFGTDSCETQENVCMDEEAASCALLPYDYYHNCMSAAETNCDLECDDMESDCMQSCSQEAQVCVMNGTECIATCVEEMEDSLKDINL